MAEESSKKTNNDIVKALIIIIQNYHDSQGQQDYAKTIDTNNLVQNVSLMVNSHVRQRDRLQDIMESMSRIVKGE